MQAIGSKQAKVVRQVATPAPTVLNLAARLMRSLISGARPKSSGPRSYRREGFPEIELQRIIAGSRDKFDSL